MRTQLLAAAIATLLLSTARAQTPAAPSDPVDQAPPSVGAPPADDTNSREDALAKLPWKRSGVGKIGARAEVRIPDGYAFLDGKNASKLLAAMGNLTSGDELGLIGPEGLDWFVVYFFDEVGYVKDDEKDDLDPDEMLESIRAQLEQGNEARRAQNLPTFTLDGWAIPPRYNEDTHVLEWAERFLVEGAPSVNFKTRVLGRKGVLRVILATDPELLDGALPQYRAMMEGFRFLEGERYSEFVAGDKIAEYGLIALVAGGAGVVAAKTGLLGAVVLFLKKGWKLLVAGLVAIGALLKRMFKSQRIEG